MSAAPGPSGHGAASQLKHRLDLVAMRCHAAVESAMIGYLERKVHPAELSAAIKQAVLGPTVPRLDIASEITELVQPLYRQPAATDIHRLSFHDLGAEDMGFVSTALVYRSSLDAALLRAALSSALASHPPFSGRLGLDNSGNWFVHCNDAGVALRIATSPNTAEQLLPPQQQHDHALTSSSRRPFVSPDLSRLFTGGALFGPQTTTACFPGSSPMMRLAVVQLADGATVLAMSMLHILGDFGTMRTFLETWAAAYNGSPSASQLLPNAAPLLEALAAKPDGKRKLVDAARQYVWQHPGLGALVLFSRTLYSNWWLGNGTVQLHFHVTAERLRELKEQALADLDPFGEEGSSAGTAKAKHWVSTNDALVARLWQVVSTLPPKAGASFPLFMAVDLRRRFPALMPRNAVGNLAASALTPEVVPSQMPLGQLALLARQAIERVPMEMPESIAWSHQQAACGIQISKFVTSSVIRGPQSILIAKKGGLLISNWDLEPRNVAFGTGDNAEPVGHLIGRMTPQVSPANVFFVTKVLPASAQGGQGGVIVSAMLTNVAAKELLARKVEL